MIHILYFNGLGSGSQRHTEGMIYRLAVRYLAWRNISVKHVPVNWYAKELFPDLLDRIVKLVCNELANHDSVTLCGVSAGGSLAVNVFGKLHDKNISVTVLSGPLRFVKKDDSNILHRLALQNTARPSQNLFDSVSYCSTKTIPNLTPQAKQRIVTAKQWFDGVVPRRTMDIPGVRIKMVPAIGHMFGIIVGILYLPAILNVLQREVKNTADEK
jgi:hypothetical protein